MLRRDRLIRMQINQLLDACIVAMAFWMAFEMSISPDVAYFFGLNPVDPAHSSGYAWLYLALIPGAPLILEGQGFYSRPVLCSRTASAWVLLKCCFFMTIGLVMATFLLKIDMPRRAMLWFGPISFGSALTQRGTGSSVPAQQTGACPIPAPLHHGRHRR